MFKKKNLKIYSTKAQLVTKNAEENGYPKTLEFCLWKEIGSITGRRGQNPAQRRER
jgi:hypothetical protein